MEGSRVKDRNTITTVDMKTALILIKIGDDLTLQSPDWDEFIFTKEGYLDLKNTINEREKNE